MEIIQKGIDENSKPNPVSLYGISKLSGEMFIVNFKKDKYKGDSF